MTPQKLTIEEVAGEITSLPKWKLIYGGKLLQLIYFKDFVEAFSFLTTIAFEAEKMGHHPEMRCVYNMLEFILTTHDVEGLSDLDLKMARIIDAHAAKVLD